MNSQFDLVETVSEYADMRKDPSAFVHEIKKMFQDPNNIVALLQKQFYDANKFDFESKKFENITPARYRAAMDNALLSIHDQVFDAIERVAEKFESDISDKA